ncbi:hypothetical protein HNR56_003777 [Roseospira marina]|nr:hypothetical protein [Roseospira marina]MBB5089062.1 hypothetical protein [Roseospira marina]
MGSQNIEPSRTEETCSADSTTQITGARIVLSPVDPFYDLYLRYGSMKNALQHYKTQGQYSRISGKIISCEK